MIILRQKSYSKFGRFVGDIEKKIQSRGDKIRSKVDLKLILKRISRS